MLNKVCDRSSMVEQQVPACDGGSIPARSLQISACPVQDIKAFVERHHYSHNLNGVKISYCFRADFEGELVGAAVFGALAGPAWKRFADTETNVIELRRLVLLDRAARNSESLMIGWTLRWLKKNVPNLEIVVSYADPDQGHSGIIYRASNFTHIGMTMPDRGYRDKETGTLYHARSLSVRYRGIFKPFAQKLRDKRDAGLLQSVKLPGKHCYIFRLSGTAKPWE